MFIVVDLPQPGGAEQGDERAVLDLEIEVLDGVELAEGLRDVLDANLCHGVSA